FTEREFAERSEVKDNVEQTGPQLKKEILYSVDDSPPIQLTILLGFQQYLTAFGGLVGAPLLLRKFYCIDGDNEGLAQIIGTVFVACGISTVLQTTLGVRLPIIQGATAAFFGPIISVLSQPDMQCPYTAIQNNNGTSETLPPLGSEGHKEIWRERFRLIQGSMLVASLFQVFLGCSGMIGVMLRYIGPLTVAPTIALIGLSLFDIVADFAQGQWYIALSTSLVITIFSQYCKKLSIPCCQYSKGQGCKCEKLPIFQLFPKVGCFLRVKNRWGYQARTDIKTSSLSSSPWIRFPYPGQWGTPTISAGAVCGMLAAIIASVVESIGDYRACAKLSEAPPPPDHAMNRGVAMEGIGCILNASFGSGQATTSYSENIAAILITKVGNRQVTIAAGLLMIVFGCLGKFTALFVALPDPILGGIALITLGMVISVGISNYQYVDLNSSRNLFIIGTSLFVGLTVPRWVSENPASIHTGVELIDQILLILLRTNMLVGGVLAFILDNTIPGTKEERGLLIWNAGAQDSNKDTVCKTYDIPFIQTYLNRINCLRFIPICPTYQPGNCTRKKRNYNL
ncbi:hypothetical protein FSP39_012253, partial [Pinctada imbricata]